jgi:hypothetical protein
MYEHIIKNRAARNLHLAVSSGMCFMISILTMIASLVLVVVVPEESKQIFLTISVLSCVCLIPVVCLTGVDMINATNQYLFLRRGC